MSAQPKTMTLTLRLLRKGKSIEDAFSKTSSMSEQPSAEGENARIFVGQVYSNPPKWKEVVSRKSSVEIPALFSGGAAAVIFYSVGSAEDLWTMAICFGHAHIPLDLDAFERQFGLFVTLNAVPRDKLRTLDVATPDAITFQKRIQASKDSDLREFGIDIFRDLARVAGGTPTNQSFAKFVAGKDSLSITCNIMDGNLHRKCEEVFEMYKAREYQTDYGWIDNLTKVQDKETLTALDTHLEEAINLLRGGKPAELHMAPPEIVDYAEGSIIHYNGFGSHGTDFHRLSIEDYISELNRCDFSGTFSEIKASHKIKGAKAGTDELSEKWGVYECFIFEAEIASSNNEFRKFVLFAGDWYEVSPSFKAEVEQFFDTLEKYDVVVETTAKNERELIIELESRKDLVKLDQQKINPKGVKYANLEPCDFFSNQKYFIHLKDGHSSGPISHLWMQGVVSAEAFIADPKFRQDLRQKVKKLKPGFEAHLPMATQDPVRANYKIIFGIMRQPYKDGTLGLPFFSKVSLRAAAERIQQFGFPVAINLIRKVNA